MAVDPNQLSQDKDFLAAQPADQIKYLSAQDPDFAKAAPSDQFGYLSHVTGKQAPNVSIPKPQPSLTDVLTQPTDKTDKEYAGYTGPAGVAGATIHGLNNVAQGTLGAIKGAAAMFDPRTQPGENAFTKLPVVRAAMPLIDTAKHIPEIPQAMHDINSSADPLGHYANAGQDTAAQGAGQALTAAAGEGIGKIVGAAQRHFAPPEGNVVKGTYSPEGSKIAASLRSNARIDVPAEATIAHPAIEEGLADRGFSARDFKGRNGPQALQSGIDNAIDIQEARAKGVIDPIRGEKVDPQVLSQNPELFARFKGKADVTYGDLDAERIKMNKELRRANFYSKDPSAQYAVADPLADTHAAADQARSLVYDKASDTTGYDLRPLKRTESALIKLGDLAETTKNTLSAKAAQHEATPLVSKAATSAKSLIAAKANPISAFFSHEKQGLASPLNEFNRNMQSTFQKLKPANASRSVTLPRYNLNLTPPAGSASMTPMQQLLRLSGGEDIPGENLVLKHPEGKTPPPVNAQEPLDFGGGQHISAQRIPDILGQGLIGPDISLSPSGSLPPALQRVLPFTNPGVPSEAYPGVKTRGQEVNRS